MNTKEQADKIYNHVKDIVGDSLNDSFTGVLPNTVDRIAERLEKQEGFSTIATTAAFEIYPVFDVTVYG